MSLTLAEALAKLGELDPDEIARLFTDLGVTGRTIHSTACPVANYIRQETGCHVHVTGDVWRQTARDVWAKAPLTVGEQLAPPSVEEFVDLFDQGRYPDLIELKTP